VQDDRALLEALRRGEQDALAALFEMYSDRMYRLATGILSDDNAAQGVVQDVFLRLIERLESFEGRASLGTWLYRSTYNASIDRLRRRRPMHPIADEIEDDEGADLMPAIFVDWANAPEALIGGHEAQERIAAAIQVLPLGLRTVFILREIDDLSTAEAAAALGINEGAVKVRLHRARLALRETLSEYFSERLALR
jgi:RNA polymerase sigma-70 factor (ECF subfamily)